jgi:hypothetical protein
VDVLGAVRGEDGDDPYQIWLVVAALDDLADRLPQDVFPEAVGDFAQPGHLVVQHLAPDLDFPHKWSSGHSAYSAVWSIRYDDTFPIRAPVAQLDRASVS